MNRRSVLLAASLLLNAGLVTFLAVRPAPSPAGAAPQEIREARKAPQVSVAQPVSEARAPPKRTGIDPDSVPPATTSNSARWADGVRGLIAELRRRGVDEGTVRRLGVAQAERLFRIAARDLLEPRRKLEYWQAPTADLGYGVIEPAKLREFQRLRRERVRMLGELFGDVAAEATEHNSINHYRAGSLESPYEFAPADKRLALTEYFERDGTGVGRTPVQRLISERTPTPARELEQFEKVREILGPVLFEDYLRQASAISSRLKYELAAFQPTRAEFDELVRVDYEVMLSQPDALATTRLNAASVTKLEDARRERARDVLGDTRYGDFERSSDAAFRHLDQLARELGLGQSAARAAFTHVERARKQMLALSDDAPELGHPKIRDSMMKIRKETADHVARELGLQSMSDSEQQMVLGPALSIHPQEVAQRMFRWH